MGCGETTFASTPATGPSHEFAVGTPTLVARACEAAEDAFWTYGYKSREERALFLEAVADEIETRAEAITEIGTQETGLPVARLQGERGRTTSQLRLLPAISARVTIWIVASMKPCLTASPQRARKSA